MQPVCFMLGLLSLAGIAAFGMGVSVLYAEWADQRLRRPWRAGLYYRIVLATAMAVTGGGVVILAALAFLYMGACWT